MRIVVLVLVLLPLIAVGATQSFTLDRKSQKSMGLVVYNGFAVVQDIRQVTLPNGPLLLEYQDVASSLKASSVSTKSLTQPDGLDVLEQGYRYDLLNRESLLETYIGRKLKYSRTVLQGNTYEKVLREGILLSTNPEIVDFGDEIEISPEGVISLPNVPDGLTLSPTLVWRLNNEVIGPQEIQTQYIANDLSWRADYVLRLNEEANTLALSSWATVTNNAGISFNDATIEVVAGEVNQVHEPKMNRPEREFLARASMDVAAGPQPTPLGDYQLFSLPGRITLQNHEEKQIKFLDAKGIRYEKQYVISGNAMLGQQAREMRLPVQSVIRFDNQESNQLGVALPQGIVRAYEEQGDYLLGETRIAGIADGQEVSLTLGNAFDLSAIRQQLEYERLGDRDYMARFELTIKNSQSKSVTVQVDEFIGANRWNIQNASDKFEKVLSNAARFSLEVPAKGEKTVRYELRWSY